MAGKASEKNFFFQYDPHAAGVAIGAIVFGVITAMHVFRFVKTYKTLQLKMLVVFSMASSNEVLAYALRIPGSNSKPSGVLFSLSPLLFLITPMMATSVIYFIFSKTASLIAPHYVLVKPPLMIKIWSAGDIVCQLLVSTGAMIASRNHQSTGKGLLLVAIAIHIVILAAFTAIMAIWHRRVLGNRTASSTQMVVSIQRDLLATYIACGLILTRNLFRFIEFASGPNGAFQKHEVPFFFYEFLPMAVALVVCLQWYDSKNLVINSVTHPDNAI